MNFHVLTLFPEMVLGGLNTSIIGKAAEKDLLSIEAVNIRDYTTDKHKKVDDYPYGGGAGMLMQAQPVYDAWKSVADKIGKKPRTVYLTPQGATFTQPMAKELAKEEELVFLCGHYEGIDERVLEEIVTDYLSIGDYVLTGGELPAMVMIDAISRMVPGVLTNEESGSTESFEGNLLEYPQYSRPEIWQGKAVPEVLLSGNEKKIRQWRKEASVARTKERRPDLYAKYEALDKCREQLMKQKLLHMDMTELIQRGQARLVYAKGETIVLFDECSRIYFHTASNIEDGVEALEAIEAEGRLVDLLLLHQEFMCEPAKEKFSLEVFLTGRQAVYTRKEKLPISGLYRMDGKVQENLPEIRKLTLEQLDFVRTHYATVDDEEYMRERIESGAMYGAFYGEELTGFIGMHGEGSIGMLEVLPEYRRKHIGKALTTYMVNLLLERGLTPFGQVAVGNTASEKLQESLGLCFSKQNLYWLGK